MSSHRRALTVIVAALLLDTGLGLAYAAETPGLPWWHGLYCALANAVTVGGDIQPANGAGYVITALECALVVPLFAATLSLFTAGLTAGHVRASEKRIKDHLELRLRQHAARITAQIPGAPAPPHPTAAGERFYDRERDGT